MPKRGILLLIKQEIRDLSRNGMLLFSAACILVLVCLIGLIYRQGVLQHLPLVVADLDQTSASRQIVQQFEASGKFSVTWTGDVRQLRQDVAGGKFAAGIIIPPGIAADLKGGRSGEILLLIDGANYITANTVYAKANEILQTVNGGLAIAALEGKGVLPAAAAGVVRTLRLEQKVLNNPDYNYAYYLTYGVCGAGVFSLLMSGIAVSLVRQGQQSAFRRRELAARLLVYGGFASFVTNLAFFAVCLAFALPSRRIPAFIVLTLPFGGLIALFGFFFSRLAGQDELRVFQAGVFFATPLIFLTGYTWPRQSIPLFLQPLYWFNPLTPFLNGARAMLLSGSGWPVAGKYFLWQTCLLTAYLFLCRCLGYLPGKLVADSPIVGLE